HSYPQSVIFQSFMGFDGFFFGRLDYQDRARRMRSKEQELLWRASDSLTPPMADLFTGILPNGYNPPDGFCWDQSCDDPPIRDDPDLEDYNVDDVVQRFVNIAIAQSTVYKTNHIIMTMGSDFQYENANLWYKNLDKLSLRQRPAGQRLHRANLTWPLKTDDFLPYADNAHDFWTGTLPFRPALKRYERLSNSNLQTCNQLEVLGGSASRKGPFGVGDSHTMKNAMAVAQHHDAVSGTEKQHVANDYARRLANGWLHCQVVVSNSLAALSGSSAERLYCDNLNISVCPLTESSKKFSVTVYNPLARSVASAVRLPVNGSVYIVLDAGGKSVDCQVRTKLFLYTFNMRLYIFKSTAFIFWKKVILHLICVFQFLQVTFDPDTGLLSSLSNLETKQSIKLTQNFYWYNASDGNNAHSNQSSGAYIFRPNTSTPFVISKTAKIESFQTSVVQEVRQWFSPWVSQVVRLYADSRAVELEWTVGPLPIADSLGKEVITRMDTSIQTAEYFYTDSNGREVLQRKKNFRPTWKLRQSEPVAGNYYPINSRAFIKDDVDQLTVVTDRSQGGGSLRNGSLEIMLHRRLLYDDTRGVAEPLNETSDIFPEGLVVRGRFLLTLDRPSSAADTHRPLAEEVVLQPLLTFTDGDLDPNTQREVGTPHCMFSGLQAALPPAVHLLTLSQWDEDSVLLRLEHQFQTWESKVHSQPVTIQLQKLFSTVEVVGVSELNLSANQWKEEMKRLQWTPQSGTTIGRTHTRAHTHTQWPSFINLAQQRV
uniref:Alpha-mannosidase n=1 Tax=Gouania willdenowi TaxID=441366 RepID=A0A8C5D8L1_GOUWI